MKNTLIWALMGLAAACAAHAQTDAAVTPAAPAAASGLSFNAGVVSDYRYRGISQSRLKPAVQAGVDYASASGWYVGAWGSSIQWVKDAGGKAAVELDLYGGYKGAAGEVNYDVGALRYQYPRNGLAQLPGWANAHTTELYAAATYGVVTAKYAHAIGNLFGFVDSKHSGYLDLSASVDLGDGLSLVPHVGRQTVKHHKAASYTDYALTLAKDMGEGLSASAALVGTDAQRAVYVTPAGKFTGQSRWVLGLKYAF